MGFKPKRGSHREGGPRGSGGKERGLCSSEVNREDHTVLKEKREDREVWGKKGEDHAALVE